MGIRAHIRYGRTVLRHKWFVFLAGVKTRAPLWRLIVHDWSKFTPAEWHPYVLSFNGPWGYRDRPRWVVEAFDRAWLHHQHANPHHWQHWLLNEDSPNPRYVIRGNGDGYECWIHDTKTDACVTVPQGDDLGGRDYQMLARLRDQLNRTDVSPQPMPDHFVREMVADWMGAGRAYNGEWPEPGEWKWLRENRPRMILHPITEYRLDKVIMEMEDTPDEQP